MVNVGAVLDALDAVDLRVHSEKCLIGAGMGHNVSAYGLTPQLAKVEAIRNMAVPPRCPCCVRPLTGAPEALVLYWGRCWCQEVIRSTWWPASAGL